MHKANRKIWLLLDSKGPGGIESHVYQLATGLHRHQQDVEVVFLAERGPHPLRSALRRHGVPTRTLDGRLRTLHRRLRHARPAIVHTHGYKAGLYGRLAARVLGIPSFSTFHAGETLRGRMALYDWLDRNSAGLASRVFAVSPQIAARLPVPALVTDNFIETDGLPLSAGQQIAFVGRLSHEKAPDRFIRLAACHPQQQFHIYGDGPMSSTLQLQAPPNVQFLGSQDSMDKLWPDIGLLVMPSRHEGLPLAAIEAMARGIPVLASRVGALGSLVQEGINGWLVDSGDDAGLSGHLAEWLAQDEPGREAMRISAAQQVLKRFSAQVVIPRMLEAYWSAA